MKHATTRMIFAYWDALRGERAAPERGEIEPGEIRHVLADTFILEMNDDRSADFRLAGTRLCAFFGRELKGERFTRLWSDPGGRDLGRLLRIVAEETAGVVAGVVGTTDEDATVDLEMVLLPLRHRGRPHARILGAISPSIVPTWIGFNPLILLTTVSHRVIWPSGPLAGPAFVAAEVEEDKQRRFVVHRGGRE